MLVLILDIVLPFIFPKNVTDLSQDPELQLFRTREAGFLKSS
jgi:hypothetical protein